MSIPVQSLQKGRQIISGCLMICLSIVAFVCVGVVVVVAVVFCILKVPCASISIHLQVE